jgi:hypothetical protein
MSLVNLSEIKKQIKWHEEQIKALKELQRASSLIGGKAPAKASGSETTSKRGRKPKKKRGAITDAIKEMLNSSKNPIASKEIKNTLINKNLVEKDSTSIYTTLNSLTRRGVISKSAKGYSIKQAMKKSSGKKKV